MVHIIIVNYENWEDTRDCLVSVFRSGYRAFRVWVVDNHSSNDSLIHLRAWAKQEGHDFSGFSRAEFTESSLQSKGAILNFIQNDQNAGFAGANNIVLTKLLTEDAYVLLLNPDMMLHEDCLGAMTRCCEGKPRHTIMGAEIRYHAGNQPVLFYGGGRIRFLSGTIEPVKSRKQLEKLDYISGGCLFTHVSNFKENGLLPNDYFLYWEETEWCYRAKLKGAGLYVCENAVCYDKVSTVIGKGYLANYYYSRNGLLFLSRFRKGNIPWAILANGGRWVKRWVSGQPQRARGIYRGTIDYLKKRFHAAE